LWEYESHAQQSPLNFFELLTSFMMENNNKIIILYMVKISYSY